MYKSLGSRVYVFFHFLKAADFDAYNFFIEVSLEFHLSEVFDCTVPSRDTGRERPIRIYKPDNGQPREDIIRPIHGASHKINPVATHGLLLSPACLWATVCLYHAAT